MNLSSETFAHIRDAIVTVVGMSSGCGFFVKCGSIITSASLISNAPIYVQVKSYLYIAKIQALDRISDIAVIDIEESIEKTHWNRDLPKIKHSYLRFGSSRCTLPGSPVYSLDSVDLKSGWVQNNRAITNEWEAITTDIKLTPGSPLLNAKGQVIALSSGLAQQMAEPVIRSLLKPDVHIQMVDGIKSYTRGSLGVKMAPLTAADLIHMPKLKQVTGWIITETSAESKWQKGDLILSLNDVVVGLVPPSLILWNSLPGMSIKVIWRSRADAYATCQEMVVTLQ